MSRIKSSNTSPEAALGRALRKNGIRYRTQYGRNRIDIAIPSKKLAIFIDGCFWHRCPVHSQLPKTNRGYWLPKLRRNVERDKEKAAKLRATGWKVVRFWEHDVEKRADWCINKVARFIK